MLLVILTAVDRLAQAISLKTNVSDCILPRHEIRIITSIGESYVPLLARHQGEMSWESSASHLFSLSCFPRLVDLSRNVCWFHKLSQHHLALEIFCRRTVFLKPLELHCKLSLSTYLRPLCQKSPHSITGVCSFGQVDLSREKL